MQMPTVRERAERACETLWTLGGTSTPGRLSEALPDVLSDVGKRAEALRFAVGQDWIVRAGNRLVLTDKGVTRFGPLVRTREAVAPEPEPGYVPPVGLLDSVLSMLPPAHATFSRMIIETIIARMHLAETCNDPWPGFMAIGGSGTGKTTIHKLICRLFGWDHVPCTVNMTQAHTRGALKGIVITGLGFQPSPYMSMPYLVFEEVDKEAALVSIVDPYFLGEIRQQTRGRDYRILPVPVILANPPDKGDRYSLIHPAWRRRSVFMDTASMSAADKERIERFAYFLEKPETKRALDGILRPENLSVPGRLSAAGNAVLNCLRDVLTTDFRNRNLYSGTGPVELIVLGHLALYGGSHEQAAWSVGRAYLTITGTIDGQIVPHGLALWDKLSGHLGSGESELRSVIRSGRAATELAVRDREAEIARQNSPLEVARRNAEARERQLDGMRVLGRLGELFEPDNFYDGTGQFRIACRYTSKIAARRDGIKSAKTFIDLDASLELMRELLPELEPHVSYLEEELQRITREEQEEPEESDESGDYPDAIEATVLSDSADGSGARIGTELALSGQSVTSWLSGYRPCHACRASGRKVNGTYPAAILRAELPGQPHADLCADCFGAMRVQVGGERLQITEHFTDRLGAPLGQNSNPGMIWGQGSRQRESSQVMVSANTRTALDIAEMRAASRNRASTYGRCPYSRNHRFLTGVAGLDAPANAVRLIGSHSPDANSGSHGTAFYCCGLRKCMSSAIADLGAAGFSHYRQERL